MNTSGKINDDSVKGSTLSLDTAASLGWERDVRQVTPNRQPATRRKINKSENKTKIGTWNVRTCAQKGKIDNILKEMKRLKINILGLAEMRWKNQGDISKQGNKIIWSGGTSFERGVGMILDQQSTKYYKGHVAISDRVLLVKLRGPVIDTNIIQVYAPTEEATDADLIEFYTSLDKAKRMCNSQEVLMVMGDLNAKIGKGRDGDIIGPHGLGDRNERGNVWADWCRTNKLMISNTWFQQHPRRIWTWQSPGDRARNQIDFIAVSSRFRNGILNCKTYPGADVNSDHVPVVCTVRIKFKAIRKTTGRKRIDYRLCKDNGVQTKMREEFERALIEQDEPDNERPENQFDRFQNCVKATVEKHLPTAQINCKKEWMTNEILDLFDERRKCNRGSAEYQTLNNCIKSKCIEAHEDYLDWKCCEIERDYKPNPQQAHQRIKELSGKRKSKSAGSCIQNKQGELLFEEQHINSRWVEYIGELYNDSDRNEPPLNFKEPLSGPTITKREIEHAMERMKDGKATGPDEISVEVLKSLGDLAIDELHILFNNIYDTGKIPEDICNSIFIAIPKKAGAVKCENFRTISLISHINKILLRICINRLRNKINPEIAEEQYGFQPDKGTRNAIYLLRVLSERAIQVQTPLYLCFVDYKKAFDRVRHEEILKQLHSIGADEKDLRLVQALYYTQQASIKIGNSTSNSIPIKKGVRQGCVASPDLFNLYQETIMRGITDMEGIKVGGHNLNNIRYADDTVLIATSEIQLQKIVDKVVVESEAKGMEVNITKTECMVIQKDPKNDNTCNIMIHGEQLKNVESFKYLGSLVTTDGRCNKDIRSRIAQAKQAFMDLRNILRNKQMSFGIRFRVLKCYVWPILLYGCESWTTNAETQKNIEAFEMWCLRRMQRISYTAHKTNEEVLTQTYQTRKLMPLIGERQLSFFGHIIRKDKYEYLASCGKIPGKRARGRQRKTFIDQLKGLTNLTTQELFESARDREEWREIIHEVSKAWTRQGT